MDERLLWILASGAAMSVLALVGSVTLLLAEDTLRRLLKPLVALAAGTLLGGALFHMLPEGVEAMGPGISPYVWTAAGFVSLFLLEQFLHWHHCHRPPAEHKQPVTYMILAADGVHNFVGGLAVGAAFGVDVGLGISTFLAAAAHEIPQELGDFGVLLHGGWKKSQALLFNFLSALTFLAGGLVAYWASDTFDTRALLPFAAGNFLYLGASDLVPEVNKHHDVKSNLAHFSAFLVGLLLLLAVHVVFQH